LEKSDMVGQTGDQPATTEQRTLNISYKTSFASGFCQTGVNPVE